MAEPSVPMAASRSSKWNRAPSPAVTCVTISDPSAGRTKIIDCGKPLWAILSEANEEYRKNKKE